MRVSRPIGIIFWIGIAAMVIEDTWIDSRDMWQGDTCKMW